MVKSQPYRILVILCVLLFVGGITSTYFSLQDRSDDVDKIKEENALLISKKDSLSLAIQSFQSVVKHEKERYDSLRDIKTKTNQVIIKHITSTYENITDHDSLRVILFDRADSLRTRMDTR